MKGKQKRKALDATKAGIYSYKTQRLCNRVFLLLRAYIFLSWSFNDTTKNTKWSFYLNILLDVDSGLLNTCSGSHFPLLLCREMEPLQQRSYLLAYIRSHEKGQISYGRWLLFERGGPVCTLFTAWLTWRRCLPAASSTSEFLSHIPLRTNGFIFGTLFVLLRIFELCAERSECFLLLPFVHIYISIHVQQTHSYTRNIYGEPYVYIYAAYAQQMEILPFPVESTDGSNTANESTDCTRYANVVFELS